MKYVLFICFLMSLFSCVGEGEIDLIKNGHSDYRIIISDDADSTEQKAGAELQKYLEKCTGVHLPVVSKMNDNYPGIFIRTSEGIAENSIGFRFEHQNLVIEGGNTQYTLYAVFEFLEQYADSRFYAPGVESVPERKNIRLPENLNYTYSPPIHVRTVHSKLYYQNHNFADKQRVTHESFPYYAKGAGVHTFNRFLPADKYFQEHPEYYALIDGERRTTQPCLSNPEVYEIMKKEVAGIFQLQPGASVVSVSTNDNIQYCRCPECSAIDEEEGSPSGSIIRFVNKIATNFPNKTISTLAYQYTRKACKTKPAENVLITLCSIECDRSAPIEEKCVDFAEDLRNWKKLTDNIRIWDYTVQFTNFLAPFPNIYTLQPNISFFIQNNAKWVFEQHSHNPSSLFELRSYLMARLLWNPERKTDDIIKEFADGYYEEAGPYIQQYIGLIHEELQKDQAFFLFLYGDPSQAFSSFLDADLIEQYNNFFNEAEKSVANKPEVLKRVKTARLGVRFATLEACRANLSSHYSLSNHDWVSQEFADFRNTCASSDIEWMNETRFSVGNYSSLFEHNLNRAKSDNIVQGKPVTLITKPKKYANEDPQTLTDGVFGGGSFYADWLGFEGNDMIVLIDLEQEQEFSHISTVFLQVVNHVVFLPEKVSYYVSDDGDNFKKVGTVKNAKPLEKKSKINDTFDFDLTGEKLKGRYIKIQATNMKTAPNWHHAAGLPTWIFADEVIVL